MALTQVKTLGIADDAVTLAKQAAGTDGQIITYDASGNPTAVGPGTDGQVLTSTGAGSPPAFEALPASGATLSGSTNNTVVTVTGSNAMIGEATLTYDGTNLQAKQTGNTETSIILDSNRSAADNSIGGLVGKWDTETIGDIRFLTDDDTSNKDNGYIVFRTSAASGSLNEHLRIKPAGDVQITDGNVTLASGHGISFAATSDASGTGVSMTNELLDDYEEGEWEPVLKAGGNAVTHSAKQGFYTKIGNLVYAWWNTVWTDLGSASGNMEMHGFPFTARSNSGQFYYVGHISTSGWTVNSYDDVTDQLLLTGNNTSAICGYQTGSGNQLQASEMNSSSRMWGNITYLAN